MNPLTNVKNITKLNERELSLGMKGSWHDQYKDSAWIFVGGLPFTLTEGDILSVFSQFGEIANINLIRDRKTGKSKGYTFLCYENQKSTILAVDNLNGIKIVGRTIRVDHVENYRVPKERDDEDEITKTLRIEGCAPKTPDEIKPEVVEIEEVNHHNKPHKKSSKNKKNKKQRKRKHSSSDSSSSSSEDLSDAVPDLSVKIKKEKNDPGYEKHSNRRNDNSNIEENTNKRHHKDDLGDGKHSRNYSDNPRKDNEYGNTAKSSRETVHHSRRKEEIHKNQQNDHFKTFSDRSHNLDNSRHSSKRHNKN